jgi:IrrE N-terminal-like domain
MRKSKSNVKSLGLAALCRAQHTESPEAAIRGACLYLLKSCGIAKPPVPLKPLLQALGVSFSWSKASSHWRPGHGTASLKPVDGRLTVFVHESAAEQNWRRSRFSVAHEMVHALIIQMLGDAKLIATLDETDEAYAELERICNVGAAELLMPSTMVRNAVKEIGFSPKGLLALYDMFLISREALLWRIASLMPHASITKWRQYARKPSEDNCYRVMTCYPPYMPGNERPWLPEGATTKHLNSDIVERVAHHRIPEQVDDLEIELGGRVWKCGAVATFFAEREDTEHPRFEGFAVPDEHRQSWGNDVLMFATKKQTKTERASQMIGI